MIPFVTFNGTVENLALVRRVAITFAAEMYNTENGTPQINDETEAFVEAFYAPDHTALLFAGTLAQCREFIQDVFVKNQPTHLYIEQKGAL